MEKLKGRFVWIAGAAIVGLLVAVTGFSRFSPGQRPDRALVAACTSGDANAVQAALAKGPIPTPGTPTASRH